MALAAAVSKLATGAYHRAMPRRSKDRDETAPKPGRGLRRAAFTFASLLALVLLTSMWLFGGTGPLVRLLFERNFQPVIPGEVYRSAQPARRDLERWSPYAFRSIVNLRGNTRGRPWYLAETAFARERGIAHDTVRLNADRLPGRQTLVRLIELIDDAPRPLLLHCQGGVERSGLAGAVTVLLADHGIERAREEFDADRGYLQFFAQSDLPHVLDLYEAWLGEHSVSHTADRFRTWAQEVYAPYFYLAAFEVIGEPQDLRIRVTNRSREAIPLRSGPRGVRLGARLYESGQDTPLDEIRAPTPDRDLAPGEVVELSLPQPQGIAPGQRYRLHIDLVNEGVKWFAQMGAPALVVDWPARTKGPHSEP